MQKQGLTIVDPANSKWQVLQTTSEHFVPRSRTPLPPNTSGNKRKGNNNGWKPKPNNPSGKPCWKCLKLNKEGESIPDYITNKSKVTVSCETVKSITHLSSFATMFNPLTLICSLQHAFALLDLLWVYHQNHSKVGKYISREPVH